MKKQPRFRRTDALRGGSVAAALNHDLKVCFRSCSADVVFRDDLGKNSIG